MAESIAIHFSGVQEAELLAFLDEKAKRIPLGSDAPYWGYPRKEHRVTIYFYPEILAEYEKGKVEVLIDALGAYPTATICVELMRSQINNSCDTATEIVKILLHRFTGVIDDLFSTIWKLDQIVRFSLGHGIRFLDCYRSPFHTRVIHRKVAPFLIAVFGGVDTVAQVTGLEWNREHALLLYSYKQNGIESSRTYLGTIATGWDLHDMLLFQEGKPKWMERYLKGYSLKVRYLNRFPEFHSYHDDFTFDP